MTLTQRFSNRRVLVDILALTFGIGAWLGVNGIFVQLPLLVEDAPEKWDLPAYMAICVQLANLGPIFYGLYAKFSNRERDHLIIYGLLGASAIAMFCLIFLHEKTLYIWGSQRSVAVLGFMFVTALVGCTSSVLWMPHMRNYQEIYLVSYLVGEGLSGFLPSILALIQGVGGNPECKNGTDPIDRNVTVNRKDEYPRFSTSVFFSLLSFILFLSFMAYFALNHLSVSRGERVKPPSGTETLPIEAGTPPTYKTNSGWRMPRRTYIYLLVMMGVVCALGNSTLTSVQSYSCLPYGNVAYHLAVTLGSMALPSAMCIGFVVKNPRVDVLSFLTAGIISLAAFVIYLAVMSPAPPLQHTRIGEAIVVIAWVSVNGLIGFVKLGITTLLRPDPGKGLFYAGIATQIGSLSGAIATFFLVTSSGIFVPYSPCANGST